MAIPYRINPKTFGVNGFGLPYSDDIYSVKFGGVAEATITVPLSLPMGVMGMSGDINPIGNAGAFPQGRNKWIAVFDYGVKVDGDVWVALNATAAAPAGAGFAKTTSQLFPKAWDVYAGDVIHAFSSVNNQTMSVAFYWIQE
ncbi:MAG: hypothetical protein [Caudoviricetes sp.]|nr:MAG: hypothetical protein [Caudoviricetes sp.]